MQYRVELIVDQAALALPANKSKSMTNALERELVEKAINTALLTVFDGIEITTVRKINSVMKATC